MSLRVVRKHRAPKGALRPRGVVCQGWLPERCVRKHRAPKGALRLVALPHALTLMVHTVRKHRAPKGALRHVVATLKLWVAFESESTERQKVH